MRLRRHGWRALGDARGFTMVEFLISAVISVIVLIAIGSLYVTARQAFDLSTSQAYVQRQGTLIQEQIALWAKNAVGVQAVLCGGNTTAQRSLAIQLANPKPDGTIQMLCVYQNPEAANTDADLFVCQVASWTGGCTSGTIYNMLNVMRSEVATRLGAPLRVRNTTFTRVTCIATDPDSCGSGVGTIGQSVTTPLVNVSFDLTDNTIPNPQLNNPNNTLQPYVGLRFGFGITARN